MMILRTTLPLLCLSRPTRAAPRAGLPFLPFLPFLPCLPNGRLQAAVPCSPNQARQAKTGGAILPGVGKVRPAVP